MGGSHNGKRVDEARRGRAPGVRAFVQPPKGQSPKPVLCKACRARLADEGGQTERGVLCLRCLAGRRDATFGDRLRACRVAAGLTRLELAERSGVPAGLVARYEISYTEPRVSQLQGIAHVLGPRLALLLLGLAGEPG
jgi:hypothetical protein